MHSKLAPVFIFITAVIGVSACSSTGSNTRETEEEVLIVRIPPLYNANLSPGENQCIFEAFLFPQSHIEDVARDCAGAELANDNGLLYLTINDNGSYMLNSQTTFNGQSLGSLSDSRPLVDSLKMIFDERAKNGVYEPTSSRVVKAVGIRLPHGARYSDLITAVKTARDADADPVILLLDGYLPYIYDKRIKFIPSD